MTRKMLEAAAKACGVTLEREISGKKPHRLIEHESGEGRISVLWNPLTNSADCAAMCAKLDINTFFYLSFPRVECSAEDTGDDQVVRHSHGHNGTDTDKETAWRFAATMVAAKIGGMK